MEKRRLSNLEIIEEWTPINPVDPNALSTEEKKLRLLISLLLKARDRELQESRARAERGNRHIRRKAGLAA